MTVKERIIKILSAKKNDQGMTELELIKERTGRNGDFGATNSALHQLIKEGKAVRFRKHNPKTNRMAFFYTLVEDKTSDYKIGDKLIVVSQGPDDLHGFKIGTVVEVVAVLNGTHSAYECGWRVVAKGLEGRFTKLEQYLKPEHFKKIEAQIKKEKTFEVDSEFIVAAHKEADSKWKKKLEEKFPEALKSDKYFDFGPDRITIHGSSNPIMIGKGLAPAGFINKCLIVDRRYELIVENDTIGRAILKFKLKA